MVFSLSLNAVLCPDQVWNFSLQCKPLYHPSTLFCVKAQPSNNKNSIKNKQNKQINKQKLVQKSRAKYGPRGTPIWLITIPSYWHATEAPSNAAQNFRKMLFLIVPHGQFPDCFFTLKTEIIAPC